MASCEYCGFNLGEPPAETCPNCGLKSSGTAASPGPSEPIDAPHMPLPPAAPVRVCPNCKVAMTSSGQLEFRVGGRAGGSGFLMGNWNQLSEALQPFSIYHCPNCGRVDLYEAGL